MRVVFMGTPDFAVPSLEAVASVHRLECVYTRPDAISGRGGKRNPSPVARFAESVGIPVRKPVTLRDEAEHEALALLEPDVIVVAAYGLILPREVLDIPVHGCVNVHASLLPRWRGAAPIQRAILAGDTMTGVSIMRMEEGLDTGPYCQVLPVEIDDSNAVQLTERLARAGAEALIAALDHIGRGTCDWTPQDESEVTYAEKITKDDVAIDPLMHARDALRRVRASTPQAPTRVRVGGRLITLVTAALSDELVSPGSVACTKSDLLLGFAEGALRVDVARPEGKADMQACDWARGARLGDAPAWESAR